jgi:hypothetical protein
LTERNAYRDGDNLPKAAAPQAITHFPTAQRADLQATFKGDITCDIEFETRPRPVDGTDVINGITNDRGAGNTWNTF